MYACVFVYSLGDRLVQIWINTGQQDFDSTIYQGNFYRNVHVSNFTIFKEIVLKSLRHFSTAKKVHNDEICCCSDLKYFIVNA